MDFNVNFILGNSNKKVYVGDLINVYKNVDFIKYIDDVEDSIKRFNINYKIYTDVDNNYELLIFKLATPKGIYKDLINKKTVFIGSGYVAIRLDKDDIYKNKNFYCFFNHTFSTSAFKVKYIDNILSIGAVFSFNFYPEFIINTPKSTNFADEHGYCEFADDDENDEYYEDEDDEFEDFL